MTRISMSLISLIQAVFKIYKYWIIVAIVCNVAHLSHKIFFERKKSNNISQKEGNILYAGRMFADTTSYPLQRNWYSVGDYFCRSLLSLLAFMIAMVFKPFHFTYYTFIYNISDDALGKVIGSIFTIFLPLMPIIMLFRILLNNLNILKSDFLSTIKTDDEVEGKRFFTNNFGFLKGLLSDWNNGFQHYVCNFYIVGTNYEGIKGLYWIRLETKEFWRKNLIDVGAAVPKLLGSWKGNTADFHSDICNYDLIVKQNDSFLGIGDMFLKANKDFQTVKDIENILESKYSDRDSLILKVVRPLSNLGVHSLDIVTARDISGNIRLVDVLVWTATSSWTTHTATKVYTIDPISETANTAARWYGSNFMNTDNSGIGVKYPGVKKAILQAIECHKNIKCDWLSAIGWDAMIAEDSSLVFFEGNLASGRVPHRMFLSFGSLKYFIRNMSWVSK